MLLRAVRFGVGPAGALAAAAALALGAPAVAAPPDLPVAVVEALVRAHVAGPVLASCRAVFRAGGAEAHAVAAGPPGRGGRYLVVDAGGRTYPLAAYANPPELRCLDAAGVATLNRTIAASETVEGAVRPRWPTTTVCAFVESTRAVCWQYAPAEDAFVEVGGWTT